MNKNFWKKCTLLLLTCAMMLATVFSMGACGGKGGEDASNEPVDFTKLTYVAIGDSITWGKDGETGQQMVKPYPDLVAEELQLQNVKNCGKSGATLLYSDSNEYAMKLVQDAPSKADIVSVMMGVNDFAGAKKLGQAGDTGYDSIYGSLYNLVQQIQTKYPNAFIFFMTPLKQYRNPDVNSAGYRLSDVATAVKTVCASYQVPVLDLYELVDYSAQTDPNSDGLHPTQMFMVTYTSPYIVDFIQENYGA